MTRAQTLHQSDASSPLNVVWIEARIVELQPVRFTPAGIPVSACTLGHESSQEEAGGQRLVRFELQAVAIGDPAKMLVGARTGMWIRGSGFLATKSKRSRVPVLHLNKIEYLEGNENGFQAQIKIQEEG